MSYSSSIDNEQLASNSVTQVVCIKSVFPSFFVAYSVDLSKYKCLKYTSNCHHLKCPLVWTTDGDGCRRCSCGKYIY